jgi:hypothetical protein
LACKAATLLSTKTDVRATPAIWPVLKGALKGLTQHFILEGRDGVDAMERGYVRGFDAVAKAELFQTVIVDLLSGGPAWRDPSCAEAASRLALTLAEREEISRGIAGSRCAN